MVAKVTVEISASNICSGIVSDGITINSNKSLTYCTVGIYKNDVARVAEVPVANE